jgi:type-F conjugative transfer system pilin assembly protein TrbC
MNFYGLFLEKGLAVLHKRLLKILWVIPCVLLMGIGPNDQGKKLNHGDVSDLLNRVENEKERLGKIGAPNANNPPEALRDFLSGEYQKTIQKEVERIQQAPYLTGDRVINPSQPEKPKSSISLGRTYLFISSSVPEATLRNYAKDMSIVPNASMIMIGFVGGMKKMAPTAQFISNILIKDPTCRNDSCLGYSTEILVDPLLFRKYGISRVPALVYVPQFSAIKREEGSEGLIPETPTHFAVYGDAKLSYSFDQIYRHSKNTEAASIRDVLNGIKKGGK